MVQTIGLLLTFILHCFRTRRNLLLENLLLRQQVAVLKRKHSRPRLKLLDKLFWILARRFWSGWKQALLVVSPETVIRWHRAGFTLYWRAISMARRAVGRKRISKEVRELIFRMVAENPTWGATNPRRTHDAWLRRLRKNYLSVDETSAERSRTCQALAQLLE